MAGSVRPTANCELPATNYERRALTTNCELRITHGEPRPDSMLLVYATDRRYVMPTRLSIASAVAHSPGVREVVVLGSELGPRDVALLEAVPDRVASDARVRVIVPTASELAALGGLSTTERYPIAVYFKLLAPALIDDAHDLLWLDGDTHVRADLTAMPAPAPGHVFAAVRDWYLPDFARRRGQLPQPVCGWEGVSDATPMFNAGVMRIDARAWGDKRVTARVVDRLKRHKRWMPLPEQDALAAECAGEWTELEPTWNVQSNARGYHAMRGRDASPWLGIDVEESMRGARVVHWSGHRPWHDRACDPLLRAARGELFSIERQLDGSGPVTWGRRVARLGRAIAARVREARHRRRQARRATRATASSAEARDVNARASPR